MPPVNLAQINFTPVGTANPPAALTTAFTPLTVSNPLQITQDTNQNSTTASITPDQGVNLAKCVPLAPGHRRRIYFDIPTNYPDLFGLGYEEVDTTQSPNKYGIYPGVPNTYVPVTEFNAAMPTVCLTLGPNNVPIPETWELVNLSGENHNFHMHQTKFTVVSAPAQSGTRPPVVIGGAPPMWTMFRSSMRTVRSIPTRPASIPTAREAARMRRPGRPGRANQRRPLLRYRSSWLAITYFTATSWSMRTVA